MVPQKVFVVSAPDASKVKILTMSTEITILQLHLGLTQTLYNYRSMEQETEVKSSSTPTAADATEESSSESTDEAGDSASGKASKGPSMASIRRWVLIQQMLWKEKRLSQGQLRHLAFLGTIFHTFILPHRTSEDALYNELG